MEIVSTTYPESGATKWDTEIIDEEWAREIAEYFYDQITDFHITKNNATDESPDVYLYAVASCGRYVANISLINGEAAILHKLPDGRRELNILNF